MCVYGYMILFYGLITKYSLVYCKARVRKREGTLDHTLPKRKLIFSRQGSLSQPYFSILFLIIVMLYVYQPNNDALNHVYWVLYRVFTFPTCPRTTCSSFLRSMVLFSTKQTERRGLRGPRISEGMCLFVGILYILPFIVTLFRVYNHLCPLLVTFKSQPQSPTFHFEGDQCHEGLPTRAPHVRLTLFTLFK